MKKTSTKTKEVLADSVKALRLKQGLSQEAFADLCNIDRTYAIQIERVIANPSPEVICSIAEALQVTLPQLLDTN